MRVRLLEFYAQPGFQLLCSLGSLSGLGLNMCTCYTLGQSSVKRGGAERVTLLPEGSGSHLSAM